METVTDFIFLGSKVMSDGACSHEIKDACSLGKKAMTNLDRVLKSGESESISHSVVSDILQPHALQHARLPCPSLSPGI